MGKPVYAKITTKRSGASRVIVFAATVAFLQFFLTGIGLLPERRILGAAWILASFGAGIGTILSEIYKARRRGWDVE